MKLNHFDTSTNNKIVNIVQDIIPNIDITKVEYYPDNNDETGRDWKYNTSKQYLDNNKTSIESKKENYPPVNQYLLNFGPELIPNNLFSLVQELYPDEKITVSGHWYYPNEGYIGWHTNCDHPNTKRLYITYASEDKKSFFRYLKDGEIVTCYDNKGITIREFDIPQIPEFFWHCVGSECDRYSLGFKIEKYS